MCAGACSATTATGWTTTYGVADRLCLKVVSARPRMAPSDRMSRAVGLASRHGFRRGAMLLAALTALWLTAFASCQMFNADRGGNLARPQQQDLPRMLEECGDQMKVCGSIKESDELERRQRSGEPSQRLLSVTAQKAKSDDSEKHKQKTGNTSEDNDKNRKENDIEKKSTSTTTALATSHVIIIVVILLFLLVDAFTLQQTFKMLNVNSSRLQQNYQFSPPVSDTGGRTRTLILLLLCLSNTIRIVSLCVLYGWCRKMEAVTVRVDEGGRQDHSNDDVRRPPGARGSGTLNDWLFFLVQSFPSLLFLSSYSIIILFWAQVYYAAILYSLPLLRPTFAFFNVAVYSVYGLLALLTYLLGAYAEFRISASVVVEVLFVIVGLAFAYFGIKVASQLKSISGRHSIFKWVLLLAVLCPLLFAPRGVYFLAFAMGLVDHYYPPHLTKLAWDSIVFLLSEGAPCLLILVSFCSRKPATAPMNQLDENSGYAVLSSPLIQYNYMAGGVGESSNGRAFRLSLPSASLSTPQPSVQPSGVAPSHMHHPGGRNSQAAPPTTFAYPQPLDFDAQAFGLDAQGRVFSVAEEQAANGPGNAWGYYRRQDFT